MQRSEKCKMYCVFKRSLQSKKNINLMDISFKKHKSFIIVLVFILSSFFVNSQTISKWSIDLTPNVAVLDKLDVVSRVVSKTAGCILKISYNAGKPVFKVLYNGIKVIPEFFPSSSPTILYSTLVPVLQLNLKGVIAAFKEAMAKGETPVTKLLDADGKIITDADGNTLVKAITKDGEEVHLVEKVGVAGNFSQYAGKATKGIKNLLPLESPQDYFDN